MRDRLHALDRIEAPDLWREAERRPTGPTMPEPDGPTGGRRAVVLALALGLGLASVALLARAFPHEDAVAPADPVPSTAPSEAATTLVIGCDGTATDVLTPIVAAQPDGVHVELATATGTMGLAFFPEALDRGVIGIGLQGGSDVVELPVGPGRVACLDASNATGDSREELATSVPYDVVDPAGVWHSNVMSCHDQTRTDDRGRFGAWREVNPFDTDLPEVVRRAVPGILPTDTVEPAGYPNGDERLRRIRVVRDGEVIALIMVLGTDDEKTFFAPEVCEGSGIGGGETAGMLATPFEIDGYPRCDPYTASCSLVYLERTRYEALGGTGAQRVTFAPGTTICFLDGMFADCGPHPATTQIFALRMSPADADAFVQRHACGETFADLCT